MVSAVLALSLGLPLSFPELLTLGPTGRGGRIPFPVDPVAQSLVDGKFEVPKDGGEFAGQKWRKIMPADGAFSGIQGYSYGEISWPRNQVLVMEAAGHGMVYVNGEPLAGDPYSFGYVRLPITMKAGANQFLFGNGRGGLRASVRAPKSDVELNLADPTYPDYVVGEKMSPWAAVIVLNNTTVNQSALTLETRVGTAVSKMSLDSVSPVNARKVKFRLPSYQAKEAGDLKVQLVLKSGTGEVEKGEIVIRARTPDQTRRETFVSEIDGSVQYYAVVPPRRKAPGGGLILSVHGASVEAQSQADAYSPKEDSWVVCPTNRRPFGFDWEDWGRMDALEVLKIAKERFRPDPDRVSLTGHSMGGHGTWSLGSIFPNLWSAIAPSAGWRSFHTYTRTPRQDEGAITGLFRRAAALSDMENFVDNLRPLDIFILHGDADDNVPVSEARAMKEILTKAQIPFGYHEQPGAGHWWDGDRAPGADCLEWPELIRTLESARREAWVNGELRFVTYNPAVSRELGPFEVLRQSVRMDRSELFARRLDSGIEVITKNIEAFRSDVAVSRINGVKVSPPAKGLFVGETPVGDESVLAELNGKLQVISRTQGFGMGPRSLGPDQGPLKEMFQNRFQLVYATNGSAEENAWSYARARYDAQTWGYRGNGSVDVIADRDWKPSRRNVVLYGNAKINRVWETLMPGKVRGETGGSVAYAFWRGLEKFNVVAIGGTDLRAMRATERLPIFVSGVGYPDWMVFRPETPGLGIEGVVSAGYY
jgi:dienelactone hydrolase